MMWWLEGAAGGDRLDAVAAVVTASVQLLSLTRLLPGPPAAAQLLRRRLGPLARKNVAVLEVRAACQRAVPADLDGVFSFLVRPAPAAAESDRVVIPSEEAAVRLHSELSLLELVRRGGA